MPHTTHTLTAALESHAWPSRQAAELARGAHVVPYGKRGVIFHAGESADLVYVLLQGVVKLLFGGGGGGGGLLVRIARRGALLGVFAPDGGPSILARSEQLFTAQALSPCRVAILPTARIAQVLHQLSPAQMVRVLEHSREQWTALSQRLLAYLTMTVRERLLHAVGEVAAAFGSDDTRGRLISLRLSHDDLAALVGASRPMVSKHLKELAGQQVLVKHQGRYLLPHAAPAALATDVAPPPFDAVREVGEAASEAAQNG